MGSRTNAGKLRSRNITVLIADSKSDIVLLKSISCFGFLSAMKLPNGDRVEIPMQKLIGYCLNSEHPSGKHKARVFASVLGITVENADTLRSLVQTAAVEGEVVQQDTTAFGQQFKVDWIVPGTDKIQLRTIWEITAKNPNPRLISAFLKLNERT